SRPSWSNSGAGRRSQEGEHVLVAVEVVRGRVLRRLAHRHPVGSLAPEALVHQAGPVGVGDVMGYLGDGEAGALPRRLVEEEHEAGAAQLEGASEAAGVVTEVQERREREGLGDAPVGLAATEELDRPLAD